MFSSFHRVNLQYQVPHIKPPISSPPRHTIWGPNLPYQAPNILSQRRLHDTPYQALTNHIKPLIFYRQYDFMTHHIRPRPTISSPWYSIINTTSWHTIFGPDQPYQAPDILSSIWLHDTPYQTPDQPYQAPDILSSIWLHDTPYQAPTNHIKPLIFYRQYDFMTHHIRPRPTISSPWYSIVNMTSWHTISGPNQPYQAPDIMTRRSGVYLEVSWWNPHIPFILEIRYSGKCNTLKTQGVKVCLQAVSKCLVNEIGWRLFHSEDTWKLEL